MTALAGSLAALVPETMAQGRNDLDYMTYGQPGTSAAPAPAVSAPVGEGGGGAIAALRRAFATSPVARYAQQPPAYTPPPSSPPPIPAAVAPPARMPQPMPVAEPAHPPQPVAATAPYDAYAAAPPDAPVRHDAGYKLDAGDKLRVVVYGQEGLTNTYTIDAAGSITVPLIGQVPARGRSPAALSSEIAAKLRKGYIREPSVAVEIESYRPFFILGEVQAPGQYPYVPNMTVESAVAIAGGFSPRARRDHVTLTHTDADGVARYVVPLGTALGPGDTVQVSERWF